MSDDGYFYTGIHFRGEENDTRKYYCRYPVLRFSNRKNMRFIKRNIRLAGAIYHLPALEDFCDDDMGVKTFTASFEPSNPYDENAIVFKDGFDRTLGYIPREDAFDLSLENPDNLYIRPLWKGFYEYDYKDNKAIFEFDIVEIDDESLLSSEEKLLYQKIEPEIEAYSEQFDTYTPQHCNDLPISQVKMASAKPTGYIITCIVAFLATAFFACLMYSYNNQEYNITKKHEKLVHKKSEENILPSEKKYTPSSQPNNPTKEIYIPAKAQQNTLPDITKSVEASKVIKAIKPTPPTKEEIYNARKAVIEICQRLKKESFNAEEKNVKSYPFEFELEGSKGTLFNAVIQYNGTRYKTTITKDGEVYYKD